jgi:hypothetical protein
MYISHENTLHSYTLAEFEPMFLFSDGRDDDHSTTKPGLLDRLLLQQFWFEKTLNGLYDWRKKVLPPQSLGLKKVRVLQADSKFHKTNSNMALKIF